MIRYENAPAKLAGAFALQGSLLDYFRTLYIVACLELRGQGGGPMVFGEHASIAVTLKLKAQTPALSCTGARKQPGLRNQIYPDSLQEGCLGAVRVNLQLTSYAKASVDFE